MKISTSTLMRWAGLSALAAGLGFVVVGLFHPLNVPASVVTETWVNVHIAAILMCFFGIFGLIGIHIKQIERMGWLGHSGFSFLAVWFGIVLCFSFVEAFILPNLATASPEFVEGFLGMFSGGDSAVGLSILPLLWMISGPLYILGQLLFGIATFRAGIHPRYAGALLAASAIITPMGGLVPPEFQSLVMVPIGAAFIWLGYSLWRK